MLGYIVSICRSVSVCVSVFCFLPSFQPRYHYYVQSSERPEEMKWREVELGCHRELDNPLLQFFFLNNSFLDIMTSLHSC